MKFLFLAIISLLISSLSLAQRPQSESSQGERSAYGKSSVEEEFLPLIHERQGEQKDKGTRRRSQISPRRTTEDSDSDLQGVARQKFSLAEAQELNKWSQLIRGITDSKILFETAQNLDENQPSGLERELWKRKMNMIFLELQKLRLQKEIEELRSPSKEVQTADWMVEARKKVLGLKEESLHYVREAGTLLKTVEEEVNLFHDITHVYRFVELNSDVEEGHGKTLGKMAGAMMKKSSPAGMMMKKSSGSSLMGKSMQDTAPNSLDEILNVQRGSVTLPEFDSGRMERAVLRSLERHPRWLSSYRAQAGAEDGVVSGTSIEEPQGKRNSKIQTFLNQLGVDGIPITGEDTQRDLSSKFHAPICQGDSYACASFAITSDLGTFKDVPQLSPGLGYAFMVAGLDARKSLPNNLAEKYQHDFLSPSLQDMNWDVAHAGVASIEDSLDALKTNLIAPEKHFPFDPKKLVPERINEIPERRYGISKWTSVEGRPTETDLKRLIKGDKPPMVTIDTDVRRIAEDWVQPVQYGSIKHIINVVGFGYGADPFTGVPGDYFIVRDSLTPTPGIHYRVRAKDLIPRITGMYKITGAKIAAPDEVPKHEDSK